MKGRLRRAFRGAAESHGCSLTFDVVSESPRADSDPQLRGQVETVATDVEGVMDIVPTADFGASEDATFLLERVQENGGFATNLIVGTDHPGAYHTPSFDVDERSLEIGVDVLIHAILRVGELEDTGPVRNTSNRRTEETDD